MSRSLKALKNMICEELDSIAEKGELSAGSLDTIDKLTHSLKSIETIMAMEDSGYSNDYRYDGSYMRPTRYNQRYSRSNGQMVDRLQSMLDEATNETERKALRDCISKMEG